MHTLWLNRWTWRRNNCYFKTAWHFKSFQLSWSSSQRDIVFYDLSKSSRSLQIASQSFWNILEIASNELSIFSTFQALANAYSMNMENDKERLQHLESCCSVSQMLRCTLDAKCPKTGEGWFILKLCQIFTKFGVTTPETLIQICWMRGRILNFAKKHRKYCQKSQEESPTVDTTQMFSERL